jgi:hypothetical protein
MQGAFDAGEACLVFTNPLVGGITVAYTDRVVARLANLCLGVP